MAHIAASLAGIGLVLLPVIYCLGRILIATEGGAEQVEPQLDHDDELVVTRETGHGLSHGSHPGLPTGTILPVTPADPWGER